ncbi:unnamed protein product, partial [Fusarium equiseti]
MKPTRGSIYEAVKSKISPKSASKQPPVRYTMETVIQKSDLRTIDPTPPSTALVRSNGPRGPRPINLSDPPVSPTSPQVPSTTLHSTQTTEPAQPVSSQPPISVPDLSMQPTVKEVQDNTIYVKKPLPVQHVKELPSISMPHQVQVVTDHSDEVDNREEDSFTVIMQEQQKIIDELSADKEALTKQANCERERYLNQIQELNQEVSKWKSRAIDAASKSADVHAQMPLNRPESELVKDWQNLAFDVRNFVANHFSGVSNSRLTHWFKSRESWLQDACAEAVTGKRSGQAIIEASIWNALFVLIFGHDKVNGPICWAGRYHKPLRALVRDLQRDPTKKDVEQFTPLFHQWGTLTANIVATIQSAGHRDEQIHYVAQDLEELLSPCRSRMSNPGPYRKDLGALVNKAIDMDFK